MVALELTVAMWLLAQAPAAAPSAPVTIRFRPPRVGEIQVLRFRKERVFGKRQPCPTSGPRAAQCKKWCILSRSWAVDLSYRVGTIRAGQIGSYQVSYSRWDQSHQPCVGAPVQHPSSLKGLAFRITTTQARPLMTDPRGARLTDRLENELLEDHHTFMALHDLYASQRRLVVTSGTRVPGFETAILPVLKQMRWFEINPSAIRVRFTGTATRRGRAVALFSVQADTSMLASNGWSLPYDGCLALEVQTGRLESLEVKATPHHDGKISPRSGPRTTASITAEYP